LTIRKASINSDDETPKQVARKALISNTIAQQDEEKKFTGLTPINKLRAFIMYLIYPIILKKEVE